MDPMRSTYAFVDGFAHSFCCLVAISTGSQEPIELTSIGSSTLTHGS